MSSPKHEGSQPGIGDDPARGDAGTAAPTASKKKATSSRALLITIVVAVALVFAAAYYQEPITYFFRLRAWDPGAPARTVAAFLAAVRSDDQEAAQQYVAGGDMQPQIEAGKWVGYSSRFGTTSSVVRLDELVPEGESKPLKTEFIHLGAGSAMVTMPARAGAEAEYRLERVGGDWKLTAIRLERAPS